MHKQPTIAEMRAALEASYRSMTPQEHFQRMVRNGLINSEGQLTKLFGGDAEADPGARRPIDPGRANPNGEH
jgi:hypothetical protein